MKKYLQILFSIVTVCVYIICTLGFGLEFCSSKDKVSLSLFPKVTYCTCSSGSSEGSDCCCSEDSDGCCCNAENGGAHDSRGNDCSQDQEPAVPYYGNESHSCCHSNIFILEDFQENTDYSSVYSQDFSPVLYETISVNYQKLPYLAHSILFEHFYPPQSVKLTMPLRL